MGSCSRNRKYESIFNATWADDNALNWSYFLENNLGFGYICCYTNSEATESVVKAELNYVFSHADEGDIVCFIFSGHGSHKKLTPINKGYRLLMYDVPYVYDAPNNESTEGLLCDDELEPILAQCKAERIFLFFDTCHAGGFHYMLENLPNVEHIFFGGGAKHDGTAWVDKNNAQGCFTQCFLNDAWKECFGGFPSVKFAYPGAEDINLKDKTYYYYNYHLNNGDPYYQSAPENQPIFYDYYTDVNALKFFYLDKTGILNPEI